MSLLYFGCILSQHIIALSLLSHSHRNKHSTLYQFPINALWPPPPSLHFNFPSKDLNILSISYPPKPPTRHFPFQSQQFI